MSEMVSVGVSIDRQRHTILVVDDNPATRYATGRVLRASGFRTLEADSGSQALAQTAAHDVSAVVLDVNLPDFDGFEVCRRLRAQPRTALLPVVHLSAAYLEDEHKVAGLNSGADAYLTHPAEPPVLVATVQALVRARMAEEQVRRSEEKFREIYTQAESGIALIDFEGRIAEANPALLRMLGRVEEQVVGRSMSEFAADGWAGVIQKRMEHGIAGAELRRESFSICKPDGTEVHVEWSMSAQAGPGLRIGVASNISERMGLEQRNLQVLEREQAARIAAERHSQTKDDFIAVLSHELRNPLNAMLMGVHMLKMRETSPEVARGLAMIERNANTQARIISDILDVSRLNSGKFTLNREYVDPTALVNATLEGMKSASDARNVSITTDLTSWQGLAWLDGTRIQQVLWNLLSNAIKFSEPGGRVVLLLTRDESVMQLVVRDYGKGIDPQFLPMVFDKFAQSVSPENRAHGGLGLGMSIVKHLTELHGGSVWAHSAGAGLGTTITVELPLLSGALTESDDFGDSGKTEVEVDIQGVSVLVVEDDMQALDMLAMILRDRGAVVTTAADYATAMQVFTQNRPAVLVSDIGLPGKDGYELMREIRRQEKSGPALQPVKAIALTAFARPEDKAIALAAGFDAHLAKPLKPYKLVARIGTLATARD
jgi:PAS domain S-box-containing protein